MEILEKLDALAQMMERNLYEVQKLESNYEHMVERADQLVAMVQRVSSRIESLEAVTEKLHYEKLAQMQKWHNEDEKNNERRHKDK